MKLGFLGAAGTAVLIAGNGEVRAQSMDYGALEQLFGEPVTTSVTGSPQRASDVPATMEIITADDIRRSGALDIPGVLRHVDGIDVLQWTNDQADVSARGYNQPYSPRMLVLIDGRQVYADYYGFTPWSTLPVELSAIRQIEVVKGPNSALFGFNAAGGVINIVTYNPLYDDVNTASATGGTQNLAQGSAVSTIKLGDGSAVRLSAGGRSNSDFTTPITLPYIGTRLGDDRGAIDLDGVVRLDEKTDLNLEASHVTADQSEITGGMTPAYARYDTNSVKAQLTSDTESGLWQATAYSNWISTAYSLGEFVPLPNLDFNNQVTVVQLQDSIKVGTDHTFRVTAEYRHNSEGTTSVGGASVFYDVVAAGGMWQWQIMPTLSLTNALRIDHLMLGRSGFVPAGYPFTNSDWDRSTTTESFNSGLVWRADPEDTLRATIARGVQLPNLAELGALLINSPLANFSGVPDLQPTVVTNYELGWDRNFTSIDTMFRVSAYHQTTDEIASLSGGFIIGPGGDYFTSANVASSQADGVELGLKGKIFTDWRWGLSYTPEIITDHFAPGQTDLTAATDFQNANPVHVVNANIGWSQGPWEMDAFMRYESRFFGLVASVAGQTPSLAPIDDYVSADARVSYKLTDRVTLALSGQNITRAVQRQTSGPDVERRILGTVSVKF
jgi:outer membrane receptor for ferrienterochelin and colicins